MSNGTPPPPPGAAAPAKKGLSPLAWVGIGCAGLLLLGIIGFVALGAFAVKKGKDVLEEATGSRSIADIADDFKDNPAQAMAETVVRMNPDLELVASDASEGTITFRNSKTGEQATLNFEDIAEGRFSVSTDEGEYNISADQSAEGGVTFTGPEGETRFGGAADLSDVPGWVPRYPGADDAKSTMHSVSNGNVFGAYNFTSDEAPQRVMDRFKRLFESEGYELTSESMTTTPQGAYGALAGKLEGGRTVNVAVIGSEGEVQVTVNYNQKQ